MRDEKKEEPQDTLAGTRTPNLRFRRPTPYHWATRAMFGLSNSATKPQVTEIPSSRAI